MNQPITHPGERGASLIEVLVAILVVSLGLLAMSGLLANATRFGKTSEFRSMATLLAADITDRMRANAAGAASYDLAPTALATEAAAKAACDPCTSAELAAQDVAEWQATLFKSLPNGTGAVAYDAATDTANVWVAWRDPSALDNDNTALVDADGRSPCPPDFGDDVVASCVFFRVTL